MAALKKRTNNFSSDEKRILSELVLKYKDLVENKRTDATTNSAKLQGWIRLAEEFNTISTFCHRTHAVLKCCWENIKRQTKKDRADRKKTLFMTGMYNNNSRLILGSDLSVRILHIMLFCMFVYCRWWKTAFTSTTV